MIRLYCSPKGNEVKLIFSVTSHLLSLLAVRDGAGRVPAGLKRQVIISLDQGQIVPRSQMGLQEERGAYAAQLAVGNDGDAVTQDISLVHVVSRQEDGAA